MKMMIPTLFILLVIAAVRAVTLDGAAEGLDYFFRVRQEDFLNYKVWLEALSQSAWSTGAGWGLILTYSTYVRQKEDVLVNSLFTGIGNNLASILAGLAVIPTVFALSATSEQALTALKAGNQGLTFIYIPQLFQKMPGGEYFAAFFFLALFIAALSSLLSMLELAVKLLLDYGIARKKSTAIVFVAGAVFSLLLSGFFFLFFTMRTGIEKFRMEYLDNLQVPRGVLQNFTLIIGLEFVVMFVWWFVQSMNWYPDSWWHPFSEFTIGTCLFQWVILIIAGMALTGLLDKITRQE